MKRIIFVGILLLSINPITAFSQCGPANNVTQLVNTNNSVGLITSTKEIGQSFVATCSGNIESIMLRPVVVGTDGDHMLTLYDGVDPSSPLDSVVYSLTSFDNSSDVLITFSTPIPVVSGNTYSFMSKFLTGETNYTCASGNPYAVGSVRFHTLGDPVFSPVIPPYDQADFYFEAHYQDDLLLEAQSHFITTWKTDNPGTSTSTEITIPTTGGGYNYDVDWNNDGVFDEFGITGNVTHDFGTAGTYEIRIKGDFPRIYFNNGGDEMKITEVSQWGTISWSSMELAFFGCENLTVTATDIPDLSGVLSMSSMFRICHQFNTNIDSWDVSTVSDMSHIFRGCTSLNQPFNSWNVANVTNMQSMFDGADIFNQSLSNWNTGNVSNMFNTFYTCNQLNQNFGNWDISQVSSMSNMFGYCNSLSVANYDSTLIAWSAQTLLNGVEFGANTSEYCQADEERASIVSTYGWVIVDGGQDCTGEEFISTWNTSNIGTSGTTEITIPTTGTGYNYDVDWDNDGTFDEFNINGDLTHDFGAAGTYTIRIKGDFPRIYFNNSGDRQKILSVDAWGTIEWTDFTQSFFGCSNLIVAATDTPDLSGVTSTALSFRETNVNAGFENWDMSTINDATDMFHSVTLSTSNYDALLISWNAQALQAGVTFGGGNSMYCAGEDARTNMISADGWFITDGGIDDVIAPTPDVATLPDVTAECEVSSLTGPTATDNCSSTVTITNDAVFPITEGTTLVTWTYDDGHGNTSTRVQNIIVDDITAPVSDSISLMDIIAECDASPSAPTGTDECASVVTVTSNVAFPITTQGTTVVTWTFEDGHGNTSTQTQNVILTDVTPPTASNPDSISVQCSNDIPAIDPSSVTDEADNCAGPTVVAWVSDVTDGLSCPETITRTYSVTDAVGNSMNVEQTITVIDLTAPVADSIDLADENSLCGVTLSAPTATDNCSGSVTGVADVVFPVASVGTTTVTWTYTDACGNTSTQTQDIVIGSIDVSTSIGTDNSTIVAANAGQTYQWIDCNTDQALVNETNQTFTPTYGSDFAVIITENGCSDTSDCVLSVVGVDELSLVNISVYPNPTTGIFKIDFDGGIANIQVMDLLGREIQLPIDLELNTVDGSYLSNGNYLVRVLTESNDVFITEIILNR